MKDIPLLTPENIEVKVKQCTSRGALALLYKTARVDRKILDDVYGQMNWTNEFKTIDDTLYCGIGIREDSTKDFVWKWDAGGESDNPLDDGAKAKATASDAFKRAGFAVGIGVELYTSPIIWLDVETVQENNKWKLKDPYAKYVVTHISYNEETRVITELEISSVKSNVVVFSWSMPTHGAIAKKMTETMAKPVTAAEEVPWVEEKKLQSEKLPLKTLIGSIGAKVKELYAIEGNASKYAAIVEEVTGDPTFKCNTATEEQYDLIAAILEKLEQLEF